MQYNKAAQNIHAMA